MMKFVNKILAGDSLEILKDFDSESIDLVITSPPYFQQRDYGNGGFGIGNEKQEKEYLHNLILIFNECVRVTKKTGAIVFNIGDKYLSGSLSLLPYKFAIQAMEENNILLINNLTWAKLNPTPRQDRRKLIQSSEPFFIFSKSKNYTFNLDKFLKHLDTLNKSKRKASNNIGKKYFDLINESDLTIVEKENAKEELKKAIRDVNIGKLSSFRMKIRGVHKLAYGGQAGGRNNQINNNGFSIIRISGNKIKKDIIESPVENTKDNNHIAVFPIYIIQELIKLLTNPGGIVLDPFNGSGTTCVAAKNLQRNYIGIEINSEYVDLAKKRLRDSEKQQELFI